MVESKHRLHGTIIVKFSKIFVQYNYMYSEVIDILKLKNSFKQMKKIVGMTGIKSNETRNI